MSSEDPHSGSITGTARWYEDQQPAVGVYVMAIRVPALNLPPYTAITDDSGRYTMSGLPAGEYAVSAHREAPKMPSSQGPPGQDVFIQMVVPKKELRVSVRANGRTSHDVGLYR